MARLARPPAAVQILFRPAAPSTRRCSPLGRLRVGARPRRLRPYLTDATAARGARVRAHPTRHYRPSTPTKACLWRLAHRRPHPTSPGIPWRVRPWKSPGRSAGQLRALARRDPHHRRHWCYTGRHRLHPCPYSGPTRLSTLPCRRMDGMRTMAKAMLSSRCRRPRVSFLPAPRHSRQIPSTSP